MIEITIQTNLTTTAEAHQLGQGITCAFDDGAVVNTWDAPGGAMVRFNVTSKHLEHVCGKLEDDDRVVSYRYRRAASSDVRPADDIMNDLDLSAFNDIVSKRGFAVKPEHWDERARLTFSADSWPEDEQETIYDYTRDAWPTPPAGWSPIGDAVSPCDEGLFVDYVREA